MSKIKLLLDVVSDLRSLANSIQAVCDSLSSAEEPPAEEKSALAGQPKPNISIEQVRSVLAEKSQNGKTAAVRELLLKFGASKLSEIDSSLYADLLKEAEVL